MDNLKPSRRQVLSNALALGGSALLAGRAVANAADAIDFPIANGRRRMLAPGTFPEKAGMILQRTRPPLLETPWSVLGSNVFTPNESFYVRWHLADFPTDVDVSSYRIRIYGHVATPYQISLDELLTTFHPRDVAAVNQCSGNSRGRINPRVPGAQWFDGAMGNALWTGVPLNQLLQKAGPLPGATHVAFRSMERLVSMFPKGVLYEKVLPLEKATDDDVLVAYGMNGKQMPVLNGSPVRLVVPGWYATYWVKMLSEIEVTTHPGEHLWMDGAYKIPDLPNGSITPDQTDVRFVPITRMNPRSFFSNLDGGARLKVGSPFEIKGLAFGGDAGVKTVAFSADGGATWMNATLGKDWGPYSFREWSILFTPDRPGKITLVACATNTKDEKQPRSAGWNPGGFMYNATPHIEVNVY